MLLYDQLAAARAERYANNRMHTLYQLGGPVTNVRREKARVTVAHRTTRIEVRRKDGSVFGHADVPSAWVQDQDAPFFPEREYEAAARE